MPSIADVVDHIAESLEDIDVKLGQEHQHENESPPRVVFIPTNDSYGSPRFVDRSSRYPSMLTRFVGLDVRIWAAAEEVDEEEEEEEEESYPDLRAAELLVDKVILELQQACRGSIRFEGGEWAPTSAAALGRLYILRIRIELPVVPVEAEAEITTTTFTEVLSATLPADSPAAIETTFGLGVDEVGTPSP